MHKFALAAATALAGLSFSLSTQAGILVPIPGYPGATTTIAIAINNNNVIAGEYIDAQGAQHGFFGTIDGNYTSFDFPNDHVLLGGINDDGYIVGNANVRTTDCTQEGCAYSRAPDGTIKPITKDHAPVDGFAEQITNRRIFVGQYKNSQGGITAYVGSKTKFKSDITLPFDHATTRGRGINFRNEIVGYYDASDLSSSPAFIVRRGVATSIQYPDANAFTTLFEGINDRGTISGGWANSDVSFEQAFTYSQAKNTYTLIDVPGVQVALARGINNTDNVVISTDAGSFLYCKRQKSCPTAKGAIQVKVRVVSGARQNWIVCSKGCLTSPKTAVVKSDESKQGQIVESPPALIAEERTRVRR